MNINDKVEWVKVTHRGHTIEFRKFEGVIEAIEGATALIKSPDFKRRKRIALSKLTLKERIA